MARMMVYAWFDKGHELQETKFGDHFVSQDCTEQEAVEDTLNYMRTQFPRRGRYFDSDAVLKRVWDVSAIATKAKKFYKGSHIDDYIRDDAIGRPGKQGKEFHALDFDEVEYRVNNYVRKSEQPLPVAGLAPWQYDAATNILSAVGDNKKTILAELCARFGKTIWGGALSLESQCRLTIVASYVLTSFASFAKDLSAFEQFRSMELIDSADPNYKKEIESALKQNKQVTVFLSMCGSKKRQDRIDYLFSLDHDRLVLIDEADYGAHTNNQADPFIAARKTNDIVVLMTGTNGERACGNWEIDHYLGTTYAELLMEKAGV